MKSKSKGSSMTVVGVSAAAAAAAAAGAYWFYGSSDAAKHRTTARSWMLKARADVLEAVEMAVKKVGELDKETYMNIVEVVLKRYEKLADMVPAEMLQMTRDMKEAWLQMQQSQKKSMKKGVKKVIKRINKKIA